MYIRSLDLDVDSPDKVAQVLYDAADAYYDAHMELQSAWQDGSAGAEWGRIAKILEDAASKVERSFVRGKRRR
ncbi:MAG: hypothetical protein JSV86_05405 [Gemmatimonadota bacterium]|nr:MAG: hypothetical protein JSV86_05405 [Gemmatimonadota bacterium]